MKKNKLLITGCLQFILFTAVILCCSQFSLNGILISPTPEADLSSKSLLWTANGTIICTEDDEQYTPEICSDGAGGAIITWYDQRSITNFDIYAQRINSNGGVEWTVNGTTICTADNHQYEPRICSDGEGGAIIAWEDERTDSGNIYAQKINSSGDIQWTVNGTAACIADNEQSKARICSDDAGGAIITWNDRRVAIGQEDVYMQRINSSGDIQWTVNGTAICTENNVQANQQLLPDGAGGAVIVWEDWRYGLADIYAQRINSSGDIQWDANGTRICNQSAHQYLPHLCSDGAGGWIITWQDFRGTEPWDIYAQRINSSGDSQWTDNGIVICNEISSQDRAQICSDNAGGAIITWEDTRTPGYDIYAERINSSGDLQWIPNGTAICTVGGTQQYPQILSDGAGGAIITWEDQRAGPGNYDIYVQKINSGGGIEWTPNGTAVCTADFDQDCPQLCSDGAGGAIITWEDQREGSFYDIYAQRVGTAKAEFPWYLLLMQGGGGIVEFLSSPLGLIMIAGIGLIVIVCVVVYIKKK